MAMPEGLKMSEQRISSFKEFYPFYLAEHSDPVCRTLHYIGSTLVLSALAYIIATSQYSYLWTLLVLGYGFAWVGHYFFEHNKPATFQYPLYSFASDWVMVAQFATGRLPKQYFKSKQEIEKQKNTAV
jgi:hypothetical protein